MSKRHGLLAAIALLIAVVTFGCPPESSPVVGAWVFLIDTDCNDMDLESYVVVLNLNSTAQLLGSTLYPGTWNLVGSNITITFPSVNGVEWIFTGTLGTDEVTAGTLTKDGMGSECWTAERTAS